MAYSVAFYAHKYGIPLALAQAQIGDESGGNIHAHSPKGALGLTQVLPSTAAEMYGITPAEAARRLENPQFALDAWGRYMQKAYHTFGNWRLALAAYNAGFGAVTHYGGIPPYAETQKYVSDILAKAGSLHGASPNDAIRAGLAPPLSPSASPAPPDTRGAALAGLQSLAQGSYKPQDALGVLRDAATQQAASGGSLAASSGAPFEVKVNGRTTAQTRKALALIEKFQGTPYVWGGESPKGFDCSGLLQYVWAHAGVKIPRTTYDQFQAGMAVPKGQLKPGDAVFFKGSDSKNGLPGHVGMYIGGGQFIEAPHTGSVVHISRLAGRTDYMGARRYA